MESHDNGGIATGVESHEEEHIHMPGPSIWPFGVAFFLFVAMFGLLFFPHTGHWSDAGLGQWLLAGAITVIGAVGMGWSIVAWGLQISEA